MTDRLTETPPDSAESRATLNRHYDKAFQPAIDSGHLTLRQAIDRGNRAAYAGKLIRRHGFSTEAAEAVADNRITLVAAIQDLALSAPIPDVSVISKRRSRARPAMLVGILALAGLAFAVHLFSGSKDIATSQSSVQVQVLTDGGNRIVQVEAPDANGVLEAFCNSPRQARDLTPLGLMQSPRTGARIRVGVLRDASVEGRLLAISIRRNPETLRWRAGDGIHPIVPLQAPAGAESALERAVTPPG